MTAFGIDLSWQTLVKAKAAAGDLFCTTNYFVFLWRSGQSMTGIEPPVGDPTRLGFWAL
jgi:hypothetical protein